MGTYSFDDRVIVVAGGNGLIGTALIKYLSATNAVIVVLDQHLDNSINNKNVHYMKVDQNFTVDSIKKVVDSIEEIHGPISGLVNCMTRKASDSAKYFDEISNYTLEVWREVIQGNLDNSFLLCREIGLRMVNRRYGSIVNFCSIYGAEMGPDLRIYENLTDSHEPITTPLPYSVSKGGIQALTKHLATSWAKYNVRVNAISPGGILNNQNKEFVDAYSNRIPMARMGNVEEVVGLPIFLLSPFSTYITGQNLFIDGGLSAW